MPVSGLILPSGLTPSNLRLRDSVKQRFVDGDLYDICGRLAEMHPSVFIVELAEGDACVWAIMEDCIDGVARLMFKVDALDARVIERVRHIMHVPLHERLDNIEKWEDKVKAEQKENELEELYERVGRPMWTQLEHDGFIETRNRSYAKRGVMGPRSR